MRPIRLIIILISLALCGTLVSCIKDRGADGGGEVTPAARTIVFSLSSSSPVAGQTRATRAVDDATESEKAINRLDVFFYDTAGDLLFYPLATQLSIDKSTQRVTITIPEDTYTDVLAGESCTIYLVANTTLTRAQLTGLSLEALGKVVTANGTEQLFNLTDEAPEDFLMTGSTPATISPDVQNLGTIILRRAAAKIIVDISSASVEGYTPGTARVRISNYLDKTALGSETPVAGATDYKTSGWRTMIEGADGENPYQMDTGNAFYSYYNDWSDDVDGTTETYITLELEWTPEGSVSTDPRVYYYRIPFSYIDAGGNAALHKDRIRRNYIYQFMVNVSELGGIDPEDAVDLVANFDVIEWTDRTVDVSILSYHYLFVYNSRMQVHEQPSYEWEYRSSLDIDIDIVSVECTQYFPDGSSSLVTYTDQDPQYPTFTERSDDGRTYFTAHSMVPVNYVPLYINLKVSNAAQLFSNVQLVIFPKKYVTSSLSDPTGLLPSGAYSSPTSTTATSVWGSNSPTGDGPNDNFNFYRITTTSLDAEDEARGIMIGDPTESVPHPAGGTFVSPYNMTRTDEDSWNIISPEFIVASRRGITTQLDWETAQQRCARYRESQYPSGSWRVPTFAELAMLGEMQNDDNSAIKSLFVNASGNGWWTARNAYRIRVDLYTYAGGAGVFQDDTGSVRCVHDTWRD